MTSSSYLLDRDGLNSGRNIIDVNSNATFTQQTNYRGSYGTSSPVPYTVTTTSYHHHGYGTNSNDVNDSKKVIADVSQLIMNEQNVDLLFLASRTKSNFEKRFRKKRSSYSRININEVCLVFSVDFQT